MKELDAHNQSSNNEGLNFPSKYRTLDYVEPSTYYEFNDVARYQAVTPPNMERGIFQ